MTFHARARLSGAVLAALLMAGPAFAQERSVERPFEAGGTVHLDLAAGEYRIVGTDSNAIRVRWHTKRPGDAEWVRVRLDVDGTTAHLETANRKDGLRVTIEVPSRSNLDLTLSAGELAVRGVEGSKDVSVWAGEVEIQVGEPAKYRDVRASVQFGELTARPFDVSKGGLFRSFTAKGQGPYELHARLFAGELTLAR